MIKAGSPWLTDRTVRSIMIPRPGVVWFDLGKPQADLLAAIRVNTHSHCPVGHGEFDELIDDSAWGESEREGCVR